jgi:nicotinamide-nucleotide amidase
MPTLLTMADAIGELLKARKETVAVAESSTGGLIAAALLAVPGASAYFVGGGVIYTHGAREALLGIDLVAHPGMRPSTEPYAQLMATTIRSRLGTTWGGRHRPRGQPLWRCRRPQLYRNLRTAESQRHPRDGAIGA